jgi:hypothetical protein
MAILDRENGTYIVCIPYINIAADNNVGVRTGTFSGDHPHHPVGRPHEPVSALSGV